MNQEYKEVELPEPNDTRIITRKVVRNIKKGKKTYVYTSELPAKKKNGRKPTPNKTQIRNLISQLNEKDALDVLALIKEKLED